MATVANKTRKSMLALLNGGFLTTCFAAGKREPRVT